jgi:hydroxymethylpyrimidine/phosphomethylpyrimidine kinase
VVTVLTIAGVDSGGGAGVAADLKTFAAAGVWGTCAVTAVTAQDTTAVHAVHPIPATVVRAQIDAVLGDIGADAVKTGMLATRANVEAVAAALPPDMLLVVDPVLVSTTGAALLDQRAVDALRRRLVARATVVTPNLDEAAVLTGLPPITDREGMAAAARALVAMGAAAALVTGGHAPSGDVVADCLAVSGEADVRWLEGRRIDSANTHGTGCVLSAAVAAGLARGLGVVDACVEGKRMVERAIAAGVGLGAGAGAVVPVAGGVVAAPAPPTVVPVPATAVSARRLVGIPTIAGFAVAALVGIGMILTDTGSGALGRAVSDAALVGIFGLVALAGAHWLDHRRHVALGAAIVAASGFALVTALFGVHVHGLGEWYARLMGMAVVVIVVLIDVSALVAVRGRHPAIDRVIGVGVGLAVVLGGLALPMIGEVVTLGDAAERLYGVGVVAALVITLVVPVLDRIVNGREKLA